MDENAQFLLRGWAEKYAALIAERDALLKEREGLREALEKLFGLCAAMKFEPDAGQPHPVKDGIYGKVMQDARTALSSPAVGVGEKDGWRSIDSAPKNGTKILGASFDPVGYWRMYTMFWNVGWAGNDGVKEQGPFWQHGGVLEHPTHWRDLPEPPASPASKQGG